MSRPFLLSKKTVKSVVIALLVIAVFAGFLVALKYWEEHSSSEQPVDNASSASDRPEIYVDGKKYVLKDQVESILFIGIDSYEKPSTNSYVNGQQADLLMLLVLDHQNKTYTSLQINRDTMASFQMLGVTGENGGMTTAQIALSHAYGTGQNDSSRNTTKAVSNLLFNTEIPHFATIRMSAIATLNDAVGGVTVELLDDFDMLNSSFVKGETVTLNGEQATAYVQYRGQLEDSTNISRMARQRQYMTAWLSALKTTLEMDKNFIANTSLKIADDFISDMTVEKLDELADCFLTYTSCGILEIAGESVKGDEYMEFHVDDAALQKQVLELFWECME